MTFCTGPASGCAHTADPFQVDAYASGTYRACIADASCGWITVIRPVERDEDLGGQVGPYSSVMKG